MTRAIWIPAHIRRLPDRNTAVHAELKAARDAELRQQRRLEEELAALIEPEILAMELR
ncbi:hypothetical protein [Mesorhizobium sp. ESP-6-2]|uniref:hypothetical protein n=1 Tax=Mesorhizobium sp. ESP-6-2 TaxID=2876625 RepID=UPI001CCA3CBE|nr:hypothetical protein [Mesorhizobium sp. ESP-6-2]MBZ9807647.1 hypothetical protein [Mesorhizobium sp. ESP-6-2]